MVKSLSTLVSQDGSKGPWESLLMKAAVPKPEEKNKEVDATAQLLQPSPEAPRRGARAPPGPKKKRPSHAQRKKAAKLKKKKDVKEAEEEVGAGSEAKSLSDIISDLGVPEAESLRGSH